MSGKHKTLLTSGLRTVFDGAAATPDKESFPFIVSTEVVFFPPLQNNTLRMEFVKCNLSSLVASTPRDLFNVRSLTSPPARDVEKTPGDVKRTSKKGAGEARDDVSATTHTGAEKAKPSRP